MGDHGLKHCLEMDTTVMHMPYLAGGAEKPGSNSAARAVHSRLVSYSQPYPASSHPQYCLPSPPHARRLWHHLSSAYEGYGNMVRAIRYGYTSHSVTLLYHHFLWHGAVLHLTVICCMPASCRAAPCRTMCTWHNTAHPWVAAPCPAVCVSKPWIVLPTSHSCCAPSSTSLMGGGEEQGGSHP